MTEDESPFRSPSLESTRLVSDEDARLLSIVRYQRLTVIAALLNAAIAIPFQAALILYERIFHEVVDIFGAIYWCLVLACMFLVFQLARNVYPISTAILCSVLTVLWLFGVGVMIIVNLKAVRVMKEHGLQPGFLGMSRSAAIAQLKAAKANEPKSSPAAPSIPRIDRLQ